MTTALAPPTVYGMSASGNCYKVRLIMAHLGQPYTWTEINSAAGETRSASYLALNPNGKVPLLQLSDGRALAESNAILCFLADGSRYLPSDRWQRALVMQWLFFEQYSHEPYIAVARFIMGWLPEDHARRRELPQLRERGYQALQVMEKQLQANSFIAGDDYTVADMALYAYTHEAHMGGFDLAQTPAVVSWLQRVESQPGFAAHQY